MKKIIIESGNGNVALDIDTIDNPTAKEIDKALPLESTVSTWGDEIYFDIGVHAPDRGATLDVNIGDVAYWAQGQCLCIFFGRTPASDTEKPVPASGVVTVGKTKVDPDILRKVKPGSRVRVE
ncbi:MAG: cyclophilin-like fold protein [Candidatus Omnitrophota bacterium]